LLNECVAVDAGSLAMAAGDAERSNVRDIVLTHAHLDHIAGLPLFIDDQFSDLTEPVRVYATPEVIRILERDIFNWSIYPRFSELHNEHGPVIEYVSFSSDGNFDVKGLNFRSISVNHNVPCSGFVVSDSDGSIAITGDTAEMQNFWHTLCEVSNLRAILIECSFPDRLGELAARAFHLTPSSMARQLELMPDIDAEIYIINIKPSFRDEVIDGVNKLGDKRIRVLEVGRTYSW
jgi:ribonuclease BN (tRNA processing enzyme)